MTSRMPTNKSTTVRSFFETVRRGSVRALAALAPALAARSAERMFLTPRRHARPQWEQAWADGAERSEVRYRTQRLPTYSWGEGPAVLLVHGWEGRGTQLGSFVPALVAAGHRVVMLDMPGHGEARPALTSVADFAQALSAVIPRLGPFQAVIGHSVGGAATAFSYTLQPFAARLVLIGAPRGPQRFLDGFLGHLGLEAELRTRVARRIEKRYGLSLRGLDVSEYGQRVALPTLLIHDRGDKEVPFDHAGAFAAALPDASLYATEGLGHRRILRDPAVIALAVRFVSGEQSRPLPVPSAA